MIIIAFEGLDKSGKHTQSNLVTNWLKEEGYNVVQSEFHRYDTPTGKLIQQWLYKTWDVDKLTIELIMAADKHAQQRWFVELEEQGVDFLILDRYIGSQVCYAKASGLDSEWIEVLQKYLRKPDFSIFIDISPQESVKRKGKHGKNDRYESDIEFLTSVRNVYYDYYSKIENKLILEQVDKLGVDEIFSVIKKEISKKFLNKN